MKSGVCVCVVGICNIYYLHDYMHIDFLHLWRFSNQSSWTWPIACTNGIRFLRFQPLESPTTRSAQHKAPSEDHQFGLAAEPVSQPEMKWWRPGFQLGQGEQYTTIHEQYIGVLSFSGKNRWCKGRSQLYISCRFVPLPPTQPPGWGVTRPVRNTLQGCHDLHGSNIPTWSKSC